MKLGLAEFGFDGSTKFNGGMQMIAKGRKIFDGTVAAARRTLPRRVRIETADDIEVLRSLREVVNVTAVLPDSLAAGDPLVGRWELELREGADPQLILQTCFAHGVRLKNFNQSEPTLHDVFVHLVGDDAKEASFR